jgi:mannose-6-phosphate isomerase-like protein (cupin superfamily)
MASTSSFSYETRLNVLHGPLQVIDEKALADACEFKWYNQTLCRVNDSVVRLGVIQGEYHWHKHDQDDEFFYVVEGQLLIDLEDKTVSLSPRQGFVVPRGVVHRTRALERTVILMVENMGIIPTGN